MKFNDTYISREHRFSLGIEETSGRCYLSIPVSNALVDYEEYYWIEQAQMDVWLQRPSAALAMVSKCQNRQMDHALIYPPGANRGRAG